MQEEILHRAEKLNRTERTRRGWKKIVSVFACVVVFCTTYALILPAITIEKGQKLVCTEQSASGHQHTMDCYDAGGQPVCGYADFVLHTHDERCYAEDGTLLCPLTEYAEHTHGDGCWNTPAQPAAAEPTEDAASEAASHVHDDSCFTLHSELICGQEEHEAHAHTEACMDAETGAVVCDLSEGEGHLHTQDCWSAQKEGPICGLAEAAPENTAAQLPAPEETLPLPEEAQPELICTQQELQFHQHDAGCFDETGSLICGMMQLLRHQHTDECFQTEDIQPETRTMRYEGADYTVQVTVPAAANLPENAILSAREIPQGSEEYAMYYAWTDEMMGERSVLFCRFFDVSFLVDGAEVEPAAAVDVQISYAEPLPQEEGLETTAVHFPDAGGVELLSAEVQLNEAGGDTVVFEQDSFSVVGTAVTALNLQRDTGKNYIFYKEEYAIGVNQNGEITPMKIEIDTDGKVHPPLIEGQYQYDISRITWTYVTGTYGTYDYYYGQQTKSCGVLKNQSTKRYLALNSTSPYVGAQTSVSSSCDISVYYFGNVVRFTRFVNGSSQKGGDYFLNFNKANKQYGVGIKFEQGDYFIAAEVKDVQEIAIEPGALTISDTIKANGQLEPKLDMTKLSSDVPQGLQFVWYRRSGENSEWTKVERRCVTGEQYNVAEDGSWLNAALDKGADTDYRVQLVTADGSVIYGTDKEPVQAIYHVPYYDQLQNGDFESPKIPADADAYNEHYQPLLPNGTAGMVWKTTASDSKIEFVSVASRAFKEISEKWHDCGEAANGTQFVELNATQPGALYQDVLTTPGSKMYWSLAHRGRNGSDTMYVIIMSTEKAEAANITSQSQVQTVLGDPEAYGATIWEITSSNDQWYVWNSFSAALYPSGENATDGYTVPEGQYLTRYFFVAGDTAYDQKYDADPSLKGTVGNHLDDVHFSTELPPPAAGKVNLEITKTITRLEYDKLPETLKFSVSGFHNDSITLDKSAFMLDANGNYTATWKKQYNIGYFSSAQFTVSEDTASAQISGFDLTTSVAVNDSVPAAGSTAPITIQDQGRGKITFTNAYIQKTADFQLAKVDRQNQPLADAIFKLEAQTQDNIWEQVGTLLRTDSNGKASCDVTYDTLYRITEVEAPDGYLPLAASAYFKVKFVNGEGTLQPYDEAGNPAQWPDGFQVLPYDVMELKAINSKGVILPETGGMGTGLYYLGGAALILAACITGYLGKRKTRRRA